MATAEQIKQLREQTGAGVLDAKRALDENNGDFAKALSILRAKGAAVAEKKAATRTANSGLVSTYVHGEGRIGVLVEVNSETDFVARTEEFGQLVHDVALQIAAMNPLYVSAETIPADVLEEQKKKFEDATRSEGKPETIIPKIVQGKWINGMPRPVSIANLLSGMIRSRSRTWSRRSAPRLAKRLSSGAFVATL